MGVCHRDLSLENVLVHNDDISIVIDFGMCLRVPYIGNGAGKDGAALVGDVSTGNLRCLIQPQIPCGKRIYMSPEVMMSQAPFDGFAIDLWAAAVMLFIMLAGSPPWEFAHEADPRYRMIARRGGLARMLSDWNKPVSPSAIDLLQKMLREDPRRRLSLAQVRGHDWVRMEEGHEGTETSPPAAASHTADEGWRGGFDF